MKRFILSCSLMVTSFIAVQAQAVADNSGNNKESAASPAKKETSSKVVYASPYSMEYTEMDVQDNTVTFNNLPELNTMTMHITDAKGNEVLSKRISQKHNSADISRVGKGMHFVTLTSENSNRRKSFTLVRE